MGEQWGFDDSTGDVACPSRACVKLGVLARRHIQSPLVKENRALIGSEQ
jgi:hypothetical protein